MKGLEEYRGEVFFCEKKVRKTNTVLTNAFESLFDSGLFETQPQKRMTK